MCSSHTKNLTRTHKPYIIFLYETLVHERKIQEMIVKLGFDYYLSIDREGMSRGLAMLWRGSLDVQVTGYSRNFINVEVNEENNDRWRLTIFYGFPKSSRRQEPWNLLRTLAGLSDLPWDIIGDFNYLPARGKCGRVDRPQWFIDRFRNVVLDCNVSDISLERYQFTWSQGRGSNNVVEEWLDKAMVNPSWWNIFSRS